MSWLRSSFFSILVFIITPVFFVIGLFTLPFKPMIRYRVITQWTRVTLLLLKWCCGISFRLKGAENIPAAPTIVLSKHQSAWETLAFQVIFPPQVWVVKRELAFLPFLGWGLALLNPIFINRSAGRAALKQLEEQGKQRIAQGFWVVVFPEGTRVSPGNKGKYAIGGAWLAARSATPILPVAHNAGQFWGRNAFLKQPGCITVSVGPIIYPEKMSAAELTKKAESWIETEMLHITSA